MRTVSERTKELVTRQEVALALGVSLRTVDRMLAAGEIVPVRLRGWSVRFYVPDVVECLRNGNRKWGRKADLTTEGTDITEGEDGNPKQQHRTSNVELRTSNSGSLTTGNAESTDGRRRQ